MALKIVRNDIVEMEVDAIVNTANPKVDVGYGCDYAVYMAAGYDELLEYREKNIGEKEEGEVFITPGFDLYAKKIIHAVSPFFVDGKSGEEEKLRGCYKKCLALALEYNIKSIAFPLISTGSFGYPKLEGMRIAMDEINTFLMSNDMLIYLVVFDEVSTGFGTSLYPDLESFIDENYVSDLCEEENEFFDGALSDRMLSDRMLSNREFSDRMFSSRNFSNAPRKNVAREMSMSEHSYDDGDIFPYTIDDEEYEDELRKRLAERMSHMSDTFSEYLLYLIELKGKTNAEVYKAALLNKRTFSKIKTDKNYHPTKSTVLSLCIGGEFNLDECKDLLARAGYALSPCDKTDIIFTYFVENKLYNIVDLDEALVDHGCVYLRDV